jgi:hypothetical protein
MSVLPAQVKKFKIGRKQLCHSFAEAWLSHCVAGVYEYTMEYWLRGAKSVTSHGHLLCAGAV